MGKEEQSALEYLMTYGWAILIMIIGATFWYFGIFGGNAGAVNTASGFSKVRILEPSIRHTGTALEFTIVNGVGNTIKFLGSVPDSGINFTAGNCPIGEISLGGAVSLKPGETLDLSLPCPRTSGQSFATNIQFTYNQVIAGTEIQHMDSGVIRGVVE